MDSQQNISNFYTFSLIINPDSLDYLNFILMFKFYDKNNNFESDNFYTFYPYFFIYISELVARSILTVINSCW